MLPVAICLISSLCFWGCVQTISAPTPSQGSDLQIRTVLVVPFEAITARGKTDTVRCPISSVVCQTGPIEGEAEAFLTTQLFATVRDKMDYTLIPPAVAEGIRFKIISKNVGISPRDLLMEMGKEAGADAVLAGTLYRFRQRVGSAFSVESPASVGFGVHLIRMADGRLLWSRHFDETQQSLSEDLFKLGKFVERGGGWLSAQDLATAGLKQIMTDFPARQRPPDGLSRNISIPVLVGELGSAYAAAVVRWGTADAGNTGC